VRAGPVAPSVLLLALACSRGADRANPENSAPTPSGFEPPVLTNPEVPVRYPPDLYTAGTEGIVVLRLYADETGRIVPESTRVAEGSGHPALDSAAVRAVPSMRFAPARRDGVPVATPFLQSVQFRHPESSSGEGS
jgi:TonB family protein